MLHADVLRAKDHADHIEPKGVTGTLKARHPDFGGPAELALLSPIDGAHRTAEIGGSASLHFYKRDGTGVAFEFRRDQVYVAVTVPESTLSDLPAVNGQPLLRDALSTFPHRLADCCHGRNVPAVQVVVTSFVGAWKQKTEVRLERRDPKHPAVHPKHLC